MAPLQRHILSFFIIIIPFVVCYSTSQEDPLNIYVDHDHRTFRNLIHQSRLVFSLKRFDKLGGTSSSLKMVNVNHFGAKGDGTSDDTEAFMHAWQVACSSGDAALLVPQNNYLLKPITFSGPCKSNIAVQVSGTIEASGNPSDYSEDPAHWLMFEAVQKLKVQGGGTIDGNGNIWWQNSCKKNTKLPCKNAPTAVTFSKCDNLIVEDLTIKNGQQIHVTFQESTNVSVSGLTVTAPEDSPNTDGIHVTNTRNIQISSSIIGTGDDCISIVNGTQDLQATGITCGPGHGISIGSLGEAESGEFVSGITVNRAKLSGTTNGVRIKTWQGGSGSASNIKFQNIEMENVANPIIIDQNYCDQENPCQQEHSTVQLRNVLYQNIKGTSASEIGVNLNCSPTFACQGVVLQNIELQQGGGKASKASCNSVKLSYVGDISPRCP